MDGYEVAQRLRATPDGCRALRIAVAGYGRARTGSAPRTPASTITCSPVDPKALTALLGDRA